MVLLDRYIMKHVLGAVCFVLLVLGGLDMMFTLFDEFGSTNEAYTMGKAFMYVLMTLPRHLYDLLPISSLIGALVGLGALASSNELVVMQAAGVSVGRIVWAVMKPAAVIVLAALLLGEYVAPPLEMKAEVNKAVASGEQVLVSASGYWMKDGNRYLHANAIEPGGVLHGVTLYSISDESLPVQNMLAERAEFLGEQASGNLWQFQQVVHLDFNSATDAGTAVLTAEGHTADTVEILLGLNPELMEVLVMDADNMAMTDLWRYAGYFKAQGQDASQYFLAFWRKLFQPLTTAALVLVAVSFIFGPLRSATVGSRLFTAICFGLLFILLQRVLNILSLVYQSDPLLAVLLPIVLSAGFGWWMLRRAA